MRILFTTFYDPNYLGIRYLASTLLNCGHEVKILQLKDFKHKFLAPSDTSKHTGYFLFSHRNFSSSGDYEFPITDKELKLFSDSIEDFHPDIIGITNRSPYNHLLPLIIPPLKKAAPKAFLLGGGYGPTLEPEIMLNLGVNAIIRGEGEGSIKELVFALENDRDWRHIKNIAYLSDGKLIKNPLRPLISDLDSLPFPLYYGDHFISIEDNELSKMDMRYRSKGGVHSSTYTILTGRGCIGNCSYCAGGNWRKQYQLENLKAPLLRVRSLENVMEELQNAKNHQEKFITFSDEYLVRNSEQLLKFFTDYQQKINIPFFAHFHHKQLTEEREGKYPLLEAVRRAGARFIAIGVQSASEEFAKNVYYRKNKNEDILKSIRIFADNGLSGNFQIIGGNSLETDKDIEELYKFCAQIPFDPSLKIDWFIHTAILRLLKGSPLAEAHPELVDIEYPRNKFSYIVLLAELRNKVDEKTFNEIRNNPFYKDNPERLHFLLMQTIRDRHMQYLAKEIERLRGKEVWFWGAGEMFQYRYPLFSETKPLGILVDKTGAAPAPKEINGLKVFHPDEKLPGNKPVPIITFTSNPNAICHTIANKYPEYTDIVACALL